MPESVGAALRRATDLLVSSSATPRLDAELLLAHVLGWSRAKLIAERAADLLPTATQQFGALIERRADLEPVAYLVGAREFYGMRFAVDARVLVPRPETELLVDLAIAHARRLGATRAADIGTGSGCIAVALATHVPGLCVVAVDIAAAALAVARSNVAAHGLDAQVTLVQGDLVAPLKEPVDLLLSNPPYTMLDDIDVGVRRHEPHLALDGGVQGLAMYQRLLAAAPAVLRPRGVVLLEIDARQGAAVTALARAAFPTAQVRVHQDLADHDRVVEILS